MTPNSQNWLGLRWDNLPSTFSGIICHPPLLAQHSPSLAQARFLEIWKSGTQTSGNWGSNKIKKMKILKIHIRSVHNVRKGQISRKTYPGPIWGHFKQYFSMDLKDTNTVKQTAYFPWWANRPYSPGVGSCAGVVKSSCEAKTSLNCTSRA